MDQLDHQLLNEIWYGRKHARTARDLARRIGLSERDVRDRIRELRLAGYPIASSVHAPFGFFFPADREEAAATLSHLVSREAEIRETRKAFEAAVRAKYGVKVEQLTLRLLA